jgi:hypothetical protein
MVRSHSPTYVEPSGEAGLTKEEKSMRYLALAAMAALLTSVAYAQMGTCAASAAEKKLAGAAKTSFMTKCKGDATTACNAAAAEKKLAGAAKTSFTTKCVNDKVGS